MSTERHPSVYILASQPRGTLYISVTSDLLGRLYQHGSAETRGFVARHDVFRLVRFEILGDMDAAITREKQLKNWHRQWKINLIESENPDWHDLAPASGMEPVASNLRQDGS
ncbi:MAG: GIY-YIG nuclease family protein [Parerythrobacter sp.]